MHLKKIIYSLSGLLITNIVNATTLTVDLNDVVEQAIANHPLVLSALSDAKATDESITAAKLRRLPELTASTSAGFSSQISSIDIQQPLWTGGRIDSTIDQATYDTYAALSNLELQKYIVATRALDAWKSFVVASNKKIVYENSLNELQRFEAIMSRRVIASVSARIELDLVMNRILQSQDLYQENVQQQKIALSRLQQLIGDSIAKSALNQVIELQTLSNIVRSQSGRLKENQIFKYSQNHPEVLKSKYEMLSALAKAKVDQANIYPVLYAKYSVNYDLEKNETADNFGLTLQYAPGAGFSSYALARASTEKVNSIKQSTEAKRREIIENLQVDYQKFASARDREKSLMAAVDGTLMVTESYERQFIAGKKSWLDVLNALRELDQYKAQLVEARTDFVVAYYRLKIGLGLLPWQKGNSQK